MVGMELRSIIGEADFNYEDFPELRYTSFKFSSILEVHLHNLKKLKLEYLKVISEDYRPSSEIDLSQLPPSLKYLQATESYFIANGRNENMPQLEHLILYVPGDPILKPLVETFVNLQLKEGLKTLGLGRDATHLLSDIERLQAVTSLDLDFADDSLDLLKFPNLEKLTIGSIKDALVLESWDVPQSMEEIYLGKIFRENNNNISSFFSKLLPGLLSLTIQGRKSKWFPGMLDFSKFQNLKYLSIGGESEGFDQINLPNSIEQLGIYISSLESIDEIQFPKICASEKSNVLNATHHSSLKNHHRSACLFWEAFPLIPRSPIYPTQSLEHPLHYTILLLSLDLSRLDTFSPCCHLSAPTIDSINLRVNRLPFHLALLRACPSGPNHEGSLGD